MAINDILAASNKVPGAYIRLSFGVGERSAGDAPVRILAFGNKIAAGTQAVETSAQVFTVEDAVTLFGQGSELHLMLKAILESNSSAEVYGIAITESGGAAADTDITLSGTATADGTLSIDVGGIVADLAITSGDIAATIGPIHAAALNAAFPDAEVVMSYATTKLTATAKQKGLRGNHIRWSAEGAVAGLVWGSGSGELATGTTQDDPQNALDAVFSSKYDLLVAPYVDSAELTKFVTHVDAQAAPVEGRLARVVACNNETLATAIVSSTVTNSERLRLLWNYNSRETPSIVAARFAGGYSFNFGNDRAYNYDGFALDEIRPQYSEADRPTNSEIESALNKGLTPLAVNVAGDVLIARAITNKFQDPSGNADYRTLDIHKVDVPDVVADDLKINFGDQWSGFKLSADVANEMPPAGVATPSTIKDWIITRLLTYDAETGGSNGNYLVNILALKGNLVVELDAGTEGRVVASVPLDMVELLHQFAADLRQVG